MTTHLTIVGGGLGGLVSAIAAREAGMSVTLHEAGKALGGRARTAAAPHLANWGPHVMYSTSSLWAWLDERGLARPARRAPVVARVRFRVGGASRSLPPRGLVGAVTTLRRKDAPVDASFREWATGELRSNELAEWVCNLCAAGTFDYDSGRLSAAFVNERLRKATRLPPAVRYLPGGWNTLVGRLAERARLMDVEIVTSSRVDELPPAPVVLAIPLPRAASLLGDPELTWTGTRTAVLDTALTRRRGDPFVVSDLDASGFGETFSMADPSVAPSTEDLVQMQSGMLPGEDLDQAVARMEGLLDTGYPRWRERTTWTRRFAVSGETGAIDLPGTTWHDRPQGDRGDGVHLVGDMVAAPGILSEVTHRSALDAISRLSGAAPSRPSRLPRRKAAA